MSNVVTTRHDGMFASPVAHLLRLIPNNNDDDEDDNNSAESYGTIVVVVVVIVIVVAHGHVKTHHG